MATLYQLTQVHLEKLAIKTEHSSSGSSKDIVTDPDLQFDPFVLPKDCLDLEVDADRTDKR